MQLDQLKRGPRQHLPSPPSDLAHGQISDGQSSDGIAYPAFVVDPDTPARWSLVALHRRFCKGLGDRLVEMPTESAMNVKPLDLRTGSPLPPRVRLYVFNATDHLSERRAGDYRIQLRLPGQKPKSRGRLDESTGSMLVLAGYISEFDIFVLWDSRAHSDFPYSKGVQVAASTVHEAAINGMSVQSRSIRSVGVTEHVVVVRADELVRGMLRRDELSRDDLLADDPRPGKAVPEPGRTHGGLW